MSAPLTNRQKAWICQLADRAFNKLGAEARRRGERFYDGPAETLEREKFRHAQVAAACGKLGLRCCSQDDYKLVEAHFQELIGNHGAAFNAHVRQATDERRRVEWLIHKECQAQGLQLAYAEAICRSQNRGKSITEIDEPRALWHVLFTVRNRGLKKARQARAAVPSAAAINSTP